MSKSIGTIPLKIVTTYSKKRIESSLLNPDNYIGTDNLLQNKKGKNNANYIPGKGFVCKYDKEDILISNIRPYLKKIWYADKTGGSSADVLTLVVNKNYDSRFVFYSLFRDEFFDHMMAGSKGTKMPRGDKNQVMNFPIPEFDFRVQQKISSVLYSLDAKIELNNKINTELEEMAKTMYDYWFVQFDFPSENGKPYKSSGAEMVWNDELKREIPKGWGVKKLKEVFDYLEGPGITKEKYTNNGHKFINIKCIQENDLEIDNASMIEERYIDQYSHFLLQENDIVVSTSGT